MKICPNFLVSAVFHILTFPNDRFIIVIKSEAKNKITEV